MFAETSENFLNIRRSSSLKDMNIDTVFNLENSIY
jgi:hypothetical protein